ncbi:FAD-binding oxidoreductase [Acinetobacter qingfengensis]|uniref:FAD-dependent oxidoreductase n=1 Tax=Acinetobacter qingfengensis TaxID=1262585 RepID=A0A1E7R6Z8_9GAMM|nr:FAD-dependent oxidoreductase [Acinetobacter qingfengensis]KAA8734416.1 FAD-binding oxidoreductase [Acinetobacter qingfengensis]OEY95139.1 FAD-dependent oxidoreductase [Acinetobacter qingfengensis]
MSIQVNKPVLLNDVEFKSSQYAQSGKEWNWINPQHGECVQPANYYECSLADWHNFEALNADIECDVLVIGGGLLGSSTALHLAEQGVDTVLVEKNRIGSGASGRNGGQLTPGLARWEAEEMISQLSYDDAKRLWHFTSTEAMQLIDRILDRYGLEAQRKRGHITAAVHEGHLVALTQGADARKYLGEDYTHIVGKHQLYDYVKSENYFGGLIDDLGGHIHPLALNRGLIYGFCSHGGKVYEQTEVIDIEEKADGLYVTTHHGVIHAKKSVVLGVHHASFKLLPEHNQTTIPFYTYVCTTAPLDIKLSDLLPHDHPVYDTQFQIDYYRGVSNNRLLFGGQGTGNCWNSEKTAEYLKSRIQTVFPQLNHVKLDFVWSGTTDLTVNGATDSRKSGDKFPVYAVHGWSGHGVAQTVRIGKAIAEDFCGLSTDFEMLTQIQHQDIPLGRALAPIVIPMAKSAYGLGAMINPGKMVSF